MAQSLRHLILFILLFERICVKLLELLIAAVPELLLLEFLVFGHSGKQDLPASRALLLRFLHSFLHAVRREILLQKESDLGGTAGDLKALLHEDQDDSLKADRETAGRDILSGKFADHGVVAAAASAADTQLGHSDLKNRACVVTHAANDGGVENDPEIRLFDAVNALNDGAQVGDHLGIDHFRQLLIQICQLVFRFFQALEQTDIGIRALLCEAAFNKLPRSAIHADLVHLVEDDKDFTETVLGETAGSRHCRKNPAVIDADLEALKTKSAQGRGRCQDQLDLREIRAIHCPSAEP